MTTRTLPDPVTHMARTATRSRCGVTLPTAGYFTDDEDMFLSSRVGRCRRCLRSIEMEIEREQIGAARIAALGECRP